MMEELKRRRSSLLRGGRGNWGGGSLMVGEGRGRGEGGGE